MHLNHGYDTSGNRTYREDVIAADNSKKFDELYEYDEINRLQDFKRGNLNGAHDLISGKTIGQDWGLDPLGNWSTFDQTTTGAFNQTRTHNEANEILTVSNWDNPAHDQAGNMTTIPQPGDLNETYTLKYDAWNRLVEVVDDNGGDTVAEYQYDAFNRRIVKKTYTGVTLDETRYYYYSQQWQVLEERVDTSTDADRQYLWGVRYVDDLILRDRDTTANGTLDERMYVLSDVLFNVVAVTDDAGTVQERYAYTPYGDVTYLSASFVAHSTQESNIDNDYLYTGRRLDPETGLQLNRNRYYHQQLGRWVSRDPVGYEDGLNHYAGYFVPNGVDPIGLRWSHSIKSAPNLDGSPGYSLTVNQNFESNSLAAPGTQTWQTNRQRVTVLATDGQRCDQKLFEPKILDVNDINAGVNKFRVTDFVSLELGEEFDVEGLDTCLILERTPKEIGIRSYKVQGGKLSFTAPKLPAGNNYIANEKQWARALGKSPPKLATVVEYLYYNSEACCKCSENVQEAARKAVKAATGEEVGDASGIGIEYLKYGDIGEWKFVGS